jgi:hypothetical protein
MIDQFKMYGKGELNTPNYSHAFAIVPSNTVDFTYATRAIYVGVTGSVTLVTIHDEVIQFVAVPAGTVLPIRAKRVNTTGTGASSLVGLY